jgi:transcription factor STE12
MLSYQHGDGMDIVGSTFGSVGQDVQMCKVEVDGNGLAFPNHQEVHTTYSSAPATATGLSFPENNPIDYANDGQWAFRSHGSPAFSNVSGHSSPHGSLAGSNRSSIAGPPAGYVRPSASPHLHSTTHSNSSSVASSVYGDDMTTSRSAPSHTQTFDQVPSFPSGMMESAAGAVRRHRSTTPAVFRSREPIHRPLTSASAEFTPDIHGSSPGTDGGIIGIGRQYHPYAYGHNSASQSRPGSTHSSPSVYPIPLVGDGAATLQARGRARHSLGVGSGLQEQMMMMMSMNLNHNEAPREEFFGNDANAGNPSSNVYVEGTYRTDSPTSFASQKASPAAYPIDPPPVHYGSDGYALQYEQVEKQSSYLIPPNAGSQQHQQPYGQGVDAGYYHQT